MIAIENVDIFNSPAEIIIHQANCFCTMGSGIAREIRLRYPRAYAVDKQTVKGAKSKLGQFTVAVADKDQDRTIINLYSQYNYGTAKALYTDYRAMRKGLEDIREFIYKMGWQNKVVGIPFNMGCDRGGGDWEIVQQTIQIIFGNSPIQILICKL